MTASTAPTQPPDKCPACQSAQLEDVDPEHPSAYAGYECGAMFDKRTGEIGGYCTRAFSAAIALRAERDALKSELKRYKELMPCGHPSMLAVLNDASIPVCSVCWLELAESERDAALARAEKAEERAIDNHRVSQANSIYALEMKSDRDTLRARVGELEGEITSAIFCLTGDKETWVFLSADSMLYNAENAVRVLRMALAQPAAMGETK